MLLRREEVDMNKILLILLFLVLSNAMRATEKQDITDCITMREISSCSDKIVQKLLLNVASRIVLVRCRAGEIMTDFALSQNLDSSTEQIASSVVYGDWSRDVIQYKIKQKNMLPKSIMHPYQIMLHGLAAIERAIIYGSIEKEKEKRSMERTRRADIFLMKRVIESGTLSIENAEKISQELHALMPTHEVWQESIQSCNLEEIVHGNSAYTEIMMALESNKENIAGNYKQQEKPLFFVEWSLCTRNKNGKKIECAIVNGVIRE